MKKLRIYLIALLFLAIGYFFYSETASIKVETPVIESKKLSEVLAGLKVAQISDLHIKKIGTRERRLIKIINEINPDILFITGDFISSNKGIGPCIEILRSIVMKRTVIAILGNSDHSFDKKYINTELLVKELKKIGIIVLKNESLKITLGNKINRNTRTLYVIGLDDNYLWFDDFFKAKRNVPIYSVQILLAHSPHIVEKINTKGINLILSGHTHGGQIDLPVVGALYTNPACNDREKIVSGLYKKDTLLYVNRGIGTSFLPFRLFCKPEITLFDFKP